MRGGVWLKEPSSKRQRPGDEPRSVIILNWPSYSAVNAKAPLHPSPTPPTPPFLSCSPSLRSLAVDPQSSKTANCCSKSTVVMMCRLQKKKMMLFLDARNTKAKLRAARRAAMFRPRWSIFSSSIKPLIFIFHDSQVIKCHEWVTFVSNTLSTSRQRRCMCLGFLFNSCVGFQRCIPFYI